MGDGVGVAGTTGALTTICLARIEVSTVPMPVTFTVAPVRRGAPPTTVRLFITIETAGLAELTLSVKPYDVAAWATPDTVTLGGTADEKLTNEPTKLVFGPLPVACTYCPAAGAPLLYVVEPFV